MIIKKITLSPFAGIENKAVSFLPGLNVIQGPNEAGKSTLAKAIALALFTPVNLTPAKEGAFLKDYLPIGGGDTINVILEFDAGDSFTLTRSWGGTKLSKLESSSTGLLTSAEKIQEKLLALLKLNEATWRHLLFVNQSMLTGTIHAISANPEISNSFSDILRNAVTIQGGVSPEAFRGKVTNLMDDYFRSWDPDADVPKGGRGIHNKWKNNVGKILEAFYNWKEKEDELSKRDEYDIELDTVVGKLDRLSSAIKDLDARISLQTPLVKDARARTELEAKVESVRLVLKGLKTDALEWPRLAAESESSEKEAKVLLKEIEELGDELTVAVKKERSKAKAEKYDQLVKKKKEIEPLAKEVSLITKVDEADFKNAGLWQKKIDECQTKLSSQKLVISITAKKPFTTSIAKGAEVGNEKKFEKAEVYVDTAPGKFSLETEEFVLETVSGQEPVDELIKSYEDALDSLKKVLAKYNTQDINGLKDLDGKAKQKQADLHILERDYAVLLGKDAFDGLQKEIEELQALPSVRDSARIRSESGLREGRKVELETKDKYNQAALKGFEEKYKSQSLLMDDQVDKSTELKSREKDLGLLKPLPPEVTSAEVFIADYELKRQELDNLKDEQSRLLSDKRFLEAREPEKSTLELKEELVLCGKIFEHALKEGKAYKKILEKTSQILDTDTTDLYEPYYQKTSRYFEIITQGKYKNVVMDDVMPDEIADGKIKIKRHLLSLGTQDSLALALRLSMAEYFLKDEYGFLIMDDPLTDMDPARQKSAADCISQFAKDKQILLFTCHPSHTNLLGGNLISLS